MDTITELSNRIKFTSEAIYINDEPTILLCSSLFYFRIPRGLWKDRMEKLKSAGYNCIDVYFPWNFHELTKDNWDFTGERNVEEFLRLAAEENLYVIARIGPYICSEWDGGALPAYLFTEKQMKLRDNDELYLSHVKRWYDKILPVVKEFQLGVQGTIIAVQIENELDFYECKDVKGYIEKLRDMVTEFKIEVPIIACAGMGQIAKAGGNVEGVVPALNFYPKNREVRFENYVNNYYEEMQNRNLPLLVTETNREHFLLRRLLSSGSKLISPYNQTGGTDFGFTNGINNWADILSLQTSNYDFKSMITSTGELREEFYEARLFSQFIKSLGSSLSAAYCMRNNDIKLETDMTVIDGGLNLLKLKEGGFILAVPNVDGKDGKASFTVDSAALGEKLEFPKYTEFIVSTDKCPLLLMDIPLSIWKVPGKIVYSTAELGFTKIVDNGASMVFYTDYEGEICFEFPEDVKFCSKDLHVYNDYKRYTVSNIKGIEGKAEVYFNNGSILNIIVTDCKNASRIEDISGNGEFILLKDLNKQENEINIKSQWSYNLIDNNDLYSFSADLKEKPKYLEEIGVLRGYGWYGCKLNFDGHGKPKGILIHNGSDILSVYCNDEYLGTFNPGGSFVYTSVPEFIENDINIMVRAEIWGHSNFDDKRVPSLHLNSMKGIRNISAVLNENDVSSLWKINKDDTYCMTFTKKKDIDTYVMYFKNLENLAEVYVNGKLIGSVNKYNRFIDLSEILSEESIIEIKACNGEDLDLNDTFIFEGIKGTSWWVSGSGEEELYKKSMTCREHKLSIEFPHSIAPGKMAWIYGDLFCTTKDFKCHIVKITGKNAKLTVFFNGHLVGRLWLRSKTLNPALAGGSNEFAYLPGPWFKEEKNHLAILVETIEKDEPAAIDNIYFEVVNSF